MTQTTKQTGFTLVELAIVMTIIGLLIGGILKGQELLENARVTSTLAQIKSYDASVTAFRDIYDGIPGDLKNAGKRIPNCTDACTPFATNANDGAVGDPAWVYANLQSGAITPSAAQTAVASETTLFWIHLMKASLISGVTDSALSATTEPAWGVTHPAAKIGGGFAIGFTRGATGANVYAANLTGNVLVLAMLPTTSVITAGTGVHVLTPGRAAQMDRKMDDGVPNTGAVRSYGTDTSCDVNTATPHEYAEAVTTKDCGLVIKIQS